MGDGHQTVPSLGYAVQGLLERGADGVVHDGGARADRPGHSLAQISGIQGRRARYIGTRKNLLDLNRAAALANLYALARIRLAA